MTPNDTVAGDQLIQIKLNLAITSFSLRLVVVTPAIQTNWFVYSWNSL